MQSLFWVSLFASGYSYFIYPVLLYVGWRLYRRPVQRAEPAELPGITLIIAVHNGERLMAGKLDNSLDIDYPRDKLEIIVASDGSDDGTDDIVRRYADRGVILHATGEWVGKETAQEQAIALASHELIVFSDLGTTIPAESFRNLVCYFEDPAVGAVSSEDDFITEEGEVAGEGLYVRYEMALRHLESEMAGLVGLSGSFFAARTFLVRKHWDDNVCSDFIAAVSCYREGLRAVTAPDVRGLYRDLADPKLEYQRKLRTINRGVTSLVRNRGAMNPFRYGRFAFQVISHKLMRWLVPLALVLTLVSNALLIQVHPLYALIFAGQVLFYSLALLAWLVPAVQKIGPIRIIYYFVSVNVGIGHAVLLYLGGRRYNKWTPSERR